MPKYEKLTKAKIEDLRTAPLIEAFSHKFPAESIAEKDLQKQQEFVLHSLGNFIALYKEYKYYSGKNAVYKWVMDKYHWLPSQIRALSWEDLEFVLHDNEITEIIIWGDDESASKKPRKKNTKRKKRQRVSQP